MRRILSNLLHSLADLCDPARANIRAALRQADDAAAIKREALANISNPHSVDIVSVPIAGHRGVHINISKPRSYADEVTALLAERDAELREELDEARGRRPTRFGRKLRVAK